MAAAELCAYEVFNGGTEVDNIDVDDKVKGYNLRGKNYTVSEDGLCPRCGNSNKLYVILDKLFPMGDMPEILHNLIAKGRAILWSSQEKEGFKDPPTFLCRGFCPADPLGAGFNVNWDNVSLDQILEALDRPMKATIPPPSPQTSSVQDEDSMEEISAEKSWVVLDDFDDERSDVEKNTSLTSLTQSSSDKEGEEETEEDDDDLELDEEELIKQMLAKEQQKLTQDDSSEPVDTENSVEQNSFTSSTDSTTTMTSTATAAAAAAEASTTSSSSEAKMQYPVSTNGQCPYCQSTDVKYIIVVSDTTKDTELPHSLQELLKQKLAFKMAKGTSEPPSFQCQKCQYGFNLDWCKTNLEKIFGLPTSVSSSYTTTTTTTATNKPTSPLYTRPPAPYMPPAPYTPYAAPAVPPPRYPPPVALPPVVPPLPYHPYAPTYPGYYGYYPPAPIPQPPVPYPGYLPPGMPPPGVPPLGYPPPGVPPIPPHSVPPPNPWGAVPYAHHMYQAHPHYPPPRPRGYHPLPPRPRPPPGQYLRPPRPRPPRPWYQPPAQPAAVATVPTQEEATAEPDAEGEKSKVAAARFEVLLNQIDQAKARVRHEKELMKEFQMEVGGNAASTSQPSGGDEEPNALTDEGQKSADYEEKPPGDDSQAADGGLYLGFGSDTPMVESSVGPVEKNEPDVSADAATEKHSVSLQHGLPLDTGEDLADVTTSPARDTTQASVHSDVDTSSAVVETEDDSQTVSSDYVPSSSEPCAEDASSIEALPKPGRRPGRAKKRGAPPAASRQTRRSRRSAPATPTEEDTDSTAAEEEALPAVGRLRKSRRTRSLEKKEEGESVEKVFDGEKEESETVGSDVEVEGSSDVLSQSSILIETESDSRTLLSSSAQSPRESELEDMHPAVLNQSTSEADTVTEAVSNVTPRQRGRKTRGRKRKQESPAKVTPDSEPSSRKSRRVTVEEQSEMEVDEVQAESGEEDVASAQHKEAEGALTSPRSRRSRRTPASAVTQPDEDDQEPGAVTQPEEDDQESGDKPREESVPLHNQTTEEHEETDTTVEEMLPDPDKTQESLKKNSGPAGANKRTRKSLRSSAPVDEPRETDHSSEVTSVPDASEDDSDNRRSRMSEEDERTHEVKGDLPVSSESETVVADDKITTRRTRKSVPLTDGSDTTAVEESTKSRRTRKSAQLSQESETEDGTSVRRTRKSVELSQEPEKSESEENSSSQRTPKSIQLSSQEPESLQTEENTSGRRTRKSIQSSSQEPEASETEGISSRRRTRKSTQISQGGGTLTHKDEIPDSQELIVSMEKEKELDILPADDEAKSVRRTRKSQKSSVSIEEVSGTDEDVLLSQGSDTSTAKEEAPSNEQTTPRTRKSRKSSVETEDAAKVPIESSVAIASSEESVSSRRTRRTIKSAPPVIETAEMSQESDNLTPKEETEEEPSSPQKKVPRKTDEEATETFPKRITRTRRKK